MGHSNILQSSSPDVVFSSKMKSMLLLAVLVAVATASLLPGDENFHDHDHEHHQHDHDHHHEHPQIAILKSSSESNPETGKYSFSFETENGISVSENGEQKRYGEQPEEVASLARGSYSFPYEGVTYTVTWYADETGYHAEGDHLPK